VGTDVDVLKRIRAGFTAPAAACNKGAKAIVQATSEMIAARKGRGRGTLGGFIGRLR